MKTTLLQRRLILVACMLMSLQAFANDIGDNNYDDTVWETNFSEFSSLITNNSNYAFPDGTTTSDGWTFTGACYAMSNGTFLLGTSSGTEGTCTTPAFNYKGDVQVVLYFWSSTNGTINISIESGGTASKSTFTISGSNYYCESFIIRDCTTSTRLKIKNTNGNCRFASIRVYPMDNLLFFESFDLMTSNNTNASVGKCDNSGSTFTNTDYSEVKERKGAIFFNSIEANYQLPSISTLGSDAVLSFKTNFMENKGRECTIKIKCGGGAKLSLLESGITLGNEDTEGTISTKNEAELNKEVVRKILVTNLSSSTTISFSGECCILDQVTLSKPIVTISESSADNATVIGNALGQRHVSLGRTLTKDIWNTLCLPFDVTPASMSQQLVNGAEPTMLTLASVSADGTFNFSEVPQESTVAAGTPFLIKPKVTATNPTFYDVTLKSNPAGAAAASTETHKFIGAYSPVALLTNGTNLFLTTRNTLATPSTTSNTMNGLRAYFVVPASSGTRVTLGEEQNGIECIAIPQVEETGCIVTDLQGRRHSTSDLRKGLYLKGNRKIMIK